MPEMQMGEGVGSHQAKELALRSDLRAQSRQRIDGVVGAAARLWRIDQRNRKAFFVGNRQARHGYAMLKAGRSAVWLERLTADGRKKHAIQLKRQLGGASNGQMRQMRRVKTASVKGHAAQAGNCVGQYGFAGKIHAVHVSAQGPFC